MSRIVHRVSRIIGGLSFLLVSCLFIVPHASALTVHPAIQDIEIDPGQTETRTVTLENDEATVQTYVFSIQKFVPKGEFGQQQFLDSSDMSGLPEWMYVDRSEVTLAPGQALSLPITIRAPEDANAGGYYAALFLSRTQAAGEELAMLPRVGILFFVRVSGPAIERLILEDFATDSDSSYAHLPVGFRVSILNEGNVHLAPEGTITVRNAFGSTVAKLRVNAEGGNILPDSRRVYRVAWIKGPVPEGGGYWQGLLRELSNFAFGPYRATLELRGDGFAQPMRSEIAFSVWPWRTFVALVALVFAFVPFFFLAKRLAIMSATAKSDPLR
ncbi:hypothetical protein EDM68_01165 [Candidatus Uhrbacteria bacterium]|nr:MAG: hypothetical protein EDM68_01165 [Candidatus Uhrbacteria bacterium]